MVEPTYAEVAQLITSIATLLAVFVNIGTSLLNRRRLQGLKEDVAKTPPSLVVPVVLPLTKSLYDTDDPPPGVP